MQEKPKFNWRVCSPQFFKKPQKIFIDEAICQDARRALLKNVLLQELDRLYFLSYSVIAIVKSSTNQLLNSLCAFSVAGST